MAQTNKAKTKKTPPKKAPPPGPDKQQKTESGTGAPIRREAAAIVLLFLGIFAIIGYFDVSAWFIDIFCGVTKGLIGWGYYLFPPSLLLAAQILGFHRGRPVRFRVVSALMLPILLGAFAHLMLAGDIYAIEPGLIGKLYAGGQAMRCGGVVSGALSIFFEQMFSIYGTVPVFLISFFFFLFSATGISVPVLADKFRNRPRIEYEPVQTPPAPAVEPKPKPVPLGRKQLAAGAGSVPLYDMETGDVVPGDIIPGEKTERDSSLTEGIFPGERKELYDPKPRVQTPDQLFAESQSKPEESSEPVQEAREIESTELIEPIEDNWTVDDTGTELLLPEETEPEERSVVQEIYDPPRESTTAKNNRAAILESEREEIAKTIEDIIDLDPGDYRFPPVQLLGSGDNTNVDGREEIVLNRDRLDATLQSFGVHATVSGYTRGPTVTRYDLELEAGVKLAKLLNLSGDIALALGVTNVRIAPIPDRVSTVGIEVPNRIISTVYLRDIIESMEFRTSASKLSFAIGKDIAGSSIVGNISKLPHLLIAGTTGSGKSVCMNSLILSLLYKATPQEVRLIMIDPKMVELGIYNGIPHLYIPVVTDPKKAAGALQWSVVEMLKRYRLFSEVGVRDLAGYNAHLERLGEPTMPQVVIVIDELADLMLVASKEVEESVCRVAQMGRASGMHLVIATQRPSADVITGLMKANIPSRIAFAVSSALESRIILDTQGAEKLIGAGDMLYSPIGLGKPIRVQGAFVTDEEREEVIKFVKSSAGDAEYSEEIMQEIERAVQSGNNAGKQESGSEEDYDEMLPQAVEVIFETKQASVSMLQRRLKLGYARAARIVDQMEELGIVGENEGSKPRQILMTREQWLGRRGENAPDLEASDGLDAADDFDDLDGEDDLPPFDIEPEGEFDGDINDLDDFE